VPVRIRFTAGESLASLRPGLSSTVTVRLANPHRLADDMNSGSGRTPTLAANAKAKP